MSLCTHCRTVAAPKDAGGVLYLSHPLPHTARKLHRVIDEHYQLGPAPQGTLAVTLPAGSLSHATGLSSKR